MYPNLIVTLLASFEFCVDYVVSMFTIKYWVKSCIFFRCASVKDSYRGEFCIDNFMVRVDVYP